MQKKLIAVAVGGALSAIGAAPALAQNATVNVFGTFYGEYAVINNGNKTTTGEPYQTYDHFQNPGSEIGFRGEEKLGGGLSAWFQCVASTDFRGNGNASKTDAQAGSAWCNRNSALGLKGAFGNAFYGNWTTPWTRINTAGNVGSNDTGIWGNAHLIAGTSTTAGISSPQQSNNGIGTNGATSLGVVNNICPGVWRRRQNNLFTYETPNIAGFSAMGSVTTRNHASAATNAQFKTRLWSLGAQYANGPIFVGAAYEKHKDFYDKTRGNAAAVAAPALGANLTVPGVNRAACGTGGSVVFNANTNGCDRGSENAWTFAASYTLPINLKLGGSIQRFSADASNFDPVTNLGGKTKITTYHLGLDWTIAGPHGVRAAWSRAGNVKGNVSPVIAAPTVANPTGITGTPAAARPDAGPGTSASMYQIRYVYALSKRTELTVGASRTVNAKNAVYETGGSTTVQLKGSDSSAYGFGMRHSF
jgi:predicted porin